MVNNITRHYYGGYYHVRLQVVTEVELSEEMFESREVYEDAFKRLGSPITFSRMLEKMAVPEVEIDTVCQSLINDFEVNLVPYLKLPDFPRRFVLSEYNRILKTSPQFRTFTLAK